MSSFAPAHREYRYQQSGEAETRERVRYNYARAHGKNEFDLRTPAEKKRDSRENLITVATMALPVGWVFRGARALHYGHKLGKGAKPIVFTGRGGKQQVRFYDTVRKRYISRAEYSRRGGLETAPRYAREGYKSGTRYLERRFPRTVRTLRRAEQVRSLARRGPVGFAKQRLLNRIVPRPVQWGVGLYGAYVTVENTVGDLFHVEEAGSYRRFRTPRVFNERGSLAPSNQSKKVRWIYNRHMKKSQPRCPTGFRYDPQSNSCVRVRRKP